MAPSRRDRLTSTYCQNKLNCSSLHIDCSALRVTCTNFWPSQADMCLACSDRDKLSIMLRFFVPVPAQIYPFEQQLP